MLHDVRFALRTLLKNPGFTLVVVLTLALGIGANTAVFSVVNTVLLRPLPFPYPEQLTFLWETFPGSDRGAVSIPNLMDWRKQSDVFESIEAYDAHSLSMRGKNSPERVEATASTAGLLAMLGSKPLMGRLFLPSEDRGVHRITILGERLWRRDFAADPGILRKSVDLDGVPFTVVGVVPDIPFGFLFKGEQTELWVPLDMQSRSASQRGSHFLRGIGRLRPGSSVEQARAQMRLIGKRLAQAYPRGQNGRGISLLPAFDEVTAGSRAELILVLAAVALVLLIACANIANMLLARATGRRREFAVRIAIGAGRRRIIQQLLTEALLLSFAGAALGMVLAAWTMPLLLATAGTWLPRGTEIRLDSGVLLFTAMLAIVTGLAFGVLPALQFSRSNLHETLNEGGRQGSGAGRHGVRSVLVVLEIALSVMLLIGAALLAKSFARLNDVPLGFDPNQVLTARISLPDSSYPDSKARTVFYSRALAKLSALPGVESAGVVTVLPVDSWGIGGDFEVAGQAPFPPEQQVSVEHRAVSAGLFPALRIPLLKGRCFSEADSANTPRVMVINHAMEQQFFTHGGALGKKLRFRGSEFFTIVGIVGDVHQMGSDKAPLLEIYVPYTQIDNGLTQRMSFALRTSSDPLSVAPRVRQAIAGVDPALAVARLTPFDRILGRSFAGRRLTLVLVGAFAALAFLLGLIGIHGVLSYSVRQRVQEIGIRMALGAQRSQVMGMILRRGIALAVLGVVTGLAAAFALTRLMASLLYGVQPDDFAVFTAIPLLLLACAALAAYLPARQAMKIDPIIALRYE